MKKFIFLGVDDFSPDACRALGLNMYMPLMNQIRGGDICPPIGMNLMKIFLPPLKRNQPLMKKVLNTYLFFSSLFLKQNKTKF